jgi:polysaccharide biosynthesis protein PslJ
MMHAGTATRRVEFDRATVVMGGGFALIGASVLLGIGVETIAAVVAMGTVLAAWHQSVLRWPALVALLISIMLFVPIGRYSIPVELPFGLELYRVVVAAILAVWAGALLVDPSVRLRRSPFEFPLLIIVCATLGSLAVNIGRVGPLAPAVLKSITFFLSFVLVHYLLVSVVRSRRTVETITKLLVVGTAVVAVFAIVEQRVNFNIFDHVGAVFPFLRFNGAVEADRFGLIRAVGSSAHPIELGVLIAMAIPLGLALTFGSGRRWSIPTAILAVGVMSAASRTPILVLVAAGIVLLWLQPRDIKRLLPLAVPLIIVVKLALPGSIATLKSAFFPEGGLVQEQAAFSREADPLLAGGRVRQLGPMLDEASRTPVLGQGFATRQTGFYNPLRNAPILDNQWLGLLLEIGIVGVVGWAALIVGSIRRLARACRRRAPPQGWLAAGFAASIAGFGVAMFTFDAFAFTQVSFVFWILISLTASLLLSEREEAEVG